MTSFFIIFLIFSALIYSHELVRLAVARFFGFQTPVFALGQPVGPYYVVATKGDIEFRLYLLLFGAHVFVPELDSESRRRNQAHNWPSRQFSNFPTWQKATIVLASISSYILLAWLVLFLACNINGIPKTNVVVEKLANENHIAAEAGIKLGDYIIAVDNKNVSSSHEVVDVIHAHPGRTIQVQISRQNKSIDISITPNDSGKVGMTLHEKLSSDYQMVTIFNSFGLTTQKLSELTANIIQATGILVATRYHMQPEGGQFERHGIIALIKVCADAVARDWRQLPYFVAMFSISLAIINFIPWPGFDGNYLVRILIDGIKEKFLPKQLSSKRP